MKLKDNEKAQRLVKLLKVLADNPAQPDLGLAWREITGGKHRGSEAGYIDIDDVMDECDDNYEEVDELLDDMKNMSLRHSSRIAKEILKLLK